MQEEPQEKEKRITANAKRMAYATGVILFFIPMSIVACFHVIVVYMDFVWILFIPMGVFLGMFVLSAVWDFVQRRERDRLWLDMRIYHLNFLIVIPMILSMLISFSAFVVDMRFLFGGQVEQGGLILNYSTMIIILLSLIGAYYYLEKRDGDSRIMAFGRSMGRKDAIVVARKALEELRLKFEFQPQASKWWGPRSLFRVDLPPIELMVWQESMTIKIMGPEGEPKRKEMENRISAILKEMKDSKAVK